MAGWELFEGWITGGRGVFDYRAYVIDEGDTRKGSSAEEIGCRYWKYDGESDWER